MSQTTNIEKNLVLRLIRDDEEAFCELYALYKNRLIYFALKFVKSKEVSEDLFQDTFAAIWQTRHFINPDTSFSGYVYTIMRNRILNLLRNIKNERVLQEFILSQAIDHTDVTHEKIAENELNNLLSLARNALTKRQNEIFEMSRDKGMSHKEIAQELNISVATVQEHLSTALKSIKSYLNQSYGTYSGLILLLLCLK